jgi:hypothetical protein
MAQPEVELVQALQRIVGAGTQASAQLESVVGSAKISLQVRSEGAPDEGLRVTCPSHSIVTAQIDPSINPHNVDFYITRPRQDGVVETRLLGSTRYRDSDGKWSARFTSERFANRLDEMIIIHAEALGGEGRLLEANYIAPKP